ncbi:hypothetical protein FA532_32465, partial [Pseudomonas aeruginosa]|nr:hypothetical protein [Pseudomonas aeruginosa]
LRIIVVEGRLEGLDSSALASPRELAMTISGTFGGISTGAGVALISHQSPPWNTTERLASSISCRFESAGAEAFAWKKAGVAALPPGSETSSSSLWGAALPIDTASRYVQAINSDESGCWLINGSLSRSPKKRGTASSLWN